MGDSTASSACGSDGSICSSTLEESLEAAPHLDDVAVTFAADSDLTIIDCTPGFTSLSGPCSGSQSLRSWVFSKKFQGWIEEVTNDFRERLEPAPFVMSPPGAKNAGLIYKIRHCRLTHLIASADGQLSF